MYIYYMLINITVYWIISICMVAQRLPHKLLGNQWVVKQSYDQLSRILPDVAASSLGGELGQ